jgi:hypothetical protein
MFYVPGVLIPATEPDIPNMYIGIMYTFQAY